MKKAIVIIAAFGIMSGFFSLSVFGANHLDGETPVKKTERAVHTSAIDRRQSRSTPEPPPGMETKTFSATRSDVLLPVPGYLWRHGCGPTALAMVIAYWDGNGFDQLLPGNASSQTDLVNQAIASEGSQAKPLHYEDYSLPMDDTEDSPLPDRSELPVGDEHPHDCIADFMRTSWSSEGITYGASWSDYIGPAFTNYVNLVNPDYVPAWNEYRYYDWTLTWDVLTSEINAGRPMVFLVDTDGDSETDHFVTVVGYREETLEYACLDTWEPVNDVRWCEFEGIDWGVEWGVWGGWSFNIKGESAYEDEYEYETSDNQVVITGYRGTGGDIVIPSVIDGKPVTGIGAEAFWSTAITSVVIPDSVTSIGDWAFAECKNLSRVTLGAGVTAIGEYPFDLCPALAELVVSPDNSAYSSMDGVLFDKDKTVILLYPAGKLGAYQIPDSVTSIGDWAFDECEELTRVYIPDSVTSIGEGAFSYCTSLSRVVIPDSVTSIGDWAFDGCVSLESVVFGNGLTSLGESAFENCENLSTVYLPDSLTTINYRSFAGCTSLIFIRFGRNLELIEDEAFSNCSSLRNIFLPENLMATGYDVFLGCDQLRHIYFLGGPSDSPWDSFPPEATIYYREGAPGWEECGEEPFDVSEIVVLPADNSDNFEYVIDRGEVTITRYKGLNSWNDDTIFLVCVPPEIDGCPVVSIGDGAFQGSMVSWWDGEWQRYYVILPKTITRIGKEAFENCNLMVECALPDGLLVIGESAFHGCNNLYFSAIPPSVNVIGSRAFSGVDRVHSVTIPSSVLLIGENPFGYCNNLCAFSVDPDNKYYSSSDDGVLFNKNKTELIQYPIGALQEIYSIPEGVVHIGSEAFASCNLHTVTFPDSVISIGGKAFSDCGDLSDIGFGNGLGSIGAAAFAMCENLAEVVLPESLQNIGERAFQECWNLTSITIPDNVSHLGYGAFNLCENLQSVTLGAGITRIESSVFRGCYSLSTLTIPENVLSISENAFISCDSLSSIVLEGNPKIERFGFYDQWEECNYLRAVYCLAEPPEFENYSLPPDAKIYYRDGNPGWNGIEYLGCYQVVKLPVGSEIPPPLASNYDFDHAIILTGEKGQTTGKSARFSTEENEPEPGDEFIWWHWTAPKDGMVQFDTYWSSFDYDTEVVLAVYTGTEFGSLTEIAKKQSYSDSDDGFAMPNKVILEVEAGQEYHIAVATGVDSTLGFTVLSWFYVESFGDFVVAFENNQATIIEYRGAAAEVDIPAEINGRPVTAIGIAAFAENSALQKVAFPATVTRIEDGAFFWCEKLSEINLPAGLIKINANAFCNTGLITVAIPDSVESIGYGAFRGCVNLQSVHLGTGLSRIEARTFSGSESLETLSIPANIKFISRGAFLGSGITSLILEGPLTIEEGPLTIEEGAFYDYYEEDGNLQAIYCRAAHPVLDPFSVPPGSSIYYWEGTPGWNGITQLGGQPVIMLPAGNEIEIPEPEPQPPVAANDNFANALVLDGEQGQVSSDNTGCTLEEGEPDHRFASLWWRWTAPKSGSVNFDTFGSNYSTCLSIYTGNELNNLTNIAKNDNYLNDRSLVTFDTIAGEVYNIAVASYWKYDRRGPTTLTWFYQESDHDYGVIFVNDQAIIIRYLGTASEVEIPSEIDNFPVVAIGAHAFYGNPDVSQVVIPDSVKQIGKWAFAYCDNLTSIVLPESLVSIGEDAFFSSRLNSITIPDSVTKIGTGAFSGCGNLQSVTIGKGLTSIAAETFEGCYSLNNLFIPANIQFISRRAFTWCENLTSITLEGIVHIDRDAFYDSIEGGGEEEGENASLNCLGGPPVLENFSLLPGTVIYYHAGQTAWENIDYLNGYPVRNIESIVNTVVFIAGSKGIRTGGGELRQEVGYGQAALAPEIAAGDHWTFDGWDQDFTQVTEPLLVFAQYGGEKYQVTFDPGEHGVHAGGGALLQEVEYGRAATAPEIIAKDGWEFLGWDQEFTEITSAITVNALYAAVHSVTFIPGAIGWRSGGGALQQSVRDGQPAEEPLLIVEPGWSFERWDSDFQNITGDTIIRAIYSFTYQLPAGWNLICVNLNLDQDSQELLLHKGAMTLDASSKANVISGSLAASQACWIYCQEEDEFTVSGTALEEFDFAASLKSGWNFVGPLYYRSLWNTGAIAWGWNEQRYYPTENLLAGHGYYLYWPGDYVAPPEDTYLIIDLSVGPGATSYPVTHRSTPPAYGWTDEYKTTKLVLRKIPAGSFLMGSSESETGHGADEAMHQVTLSRDYYLGVFELTRKQWELVMGSVPGPDLGDNNPMDQASWDEIRGGAWPGLPAGNGLPADLSFMETLRARTGLNFDLPTEAQWEYACRAETTTALNSGKDLEEEEVCANLDLLANYGSQNDRSLPPGSFLPNAWGLYDMHGNLSEWCLDQYDEYMGQLYDPLGGDLEPAPGRVLRGGDWRSTAAQCRSAARSQAEREAREAGIRLCLLHNPEISTVTGKLAGIVQTGVSVRLAGDLDLQTVTGADGRFTFADLPAGNYTITPELDGYAFVPSSASVTVPMTYTGSLDFTAYAGSRSDTSVQVATGATINHADGATQIIIPPGALAADGTGELQVTSSALNSPLTGLAPGNEAIAGAAVLELPSSAIAEGDDQVFEFRVPLLPATRNPDPSYNLTLTVVEVYDPANPSKRYTKELFGACSENQTRSGIMSVFCTLSTLAEIRREALNALGLAAIDAAKTVVTTTVVSVKDQFIKAMDWAIERGIDVYQNIPYFNVRAFISRWDPNAWDMDIKFEGGKTNVTRTPGAFVKRPKQEDLTCKRVVVFLHGWQTLAGALTGFDTGLLNPHVTTWERLARYATMKWGNTELREQYAYFSVRYDSDKDVFDNAVNIRKLLADAFPDKKVIIIAHSMGGIISRAMLNKFHPDGEAFAEWSNGGIERIISLNTPYHGTPFVQLVHGTLQLADEMRLQQIPITSRVLAFFQLTTPGTLCLAWDDYDGKFSGLDVFKNPDLLELNQLGGNDPLLQYYTFGTTIVAAQTRGEWLLTNVSGDAVASCGYSNDGIVPKVSAHLRGTGNTVRTVEMGDSLPHGNYSHTKVYSGHGIKKDDPFSYDRVLYDEILGCLIPEPQVVAGEYLVIDLSAGPSASSYPVSTCTTAPAGGWTDEYKTTKLVLRKIPAGSFIMGSPANELGRDSDETLHQVTLTKDFYVGVFEVTQKQWERVMGNWPSWFSNASYCDARPVEGVSYDDIRGSSAGAGWPDNNAVDANSFLGRLRAKTGLAFDLPTEAQWEYSCRAGTTTALNSGKNLTDTGECSNVAEVGRYWYNGGSGYSSDGNTSVGSAKVGSYLPNQWGLYDMHGNVWEWCLDWYQSELGSAAQTDPRGAAGGSGRVYRGGGWDNGAYGCRSAYRNGGWPSGRDCSLGFRLVRAVP